MPGAVVPETRAGDSAREIKLGITRLNSGQGRAKAPLFMLAGGPGQAEINPQRFGLFQPELLGGILAEGEITVNDMLSGSLDVATPAFRSQEVADALPNARLVVFLGRTHVQIAGVNLCASQVMTQFVLDPTAPLEIGCVAEAPVVGFVLPDGSSSKEAP